MIETGAREVHHFCCLAGYGAEAINPYPAFDTVDAQARDRGLNCRARRRTHITSKPQARHPQGYVSHLTYQSYCGAQIFDAVGLAQVLSTAISLARQPPLKALA